jgi:hypothetical protein
MNTHRILQGSRTDIEKIGRDPRIEEAERALAQFHHTGAGKHASAFARACFSLVQETIRQEFPSEFQRTALQRAAVKIVDAGISGAEPDRPGWLAWALTHEIRDLAIGYGLEVEPIRPNRGSATTPIELASGQLHTLTMEALRIAGSLGALSELQQILGLSTAETGPLFGVSRQAIDQWKKGGVPLERTADVDRVRDVARVLHDELIPERIPQIVRTPARGLGDRTILQVLAEPEGASRVRAYLAQLYSFAAA